MRAANTRCSTIGGYKVSQDQYTMYPPSVGDPQLEQVFTPTMAMEKGFAKLMSSRFSSPESATYGRHNLATDVMHYVTTYGHIVITITSKIEVAEYAARRLRKRSRDNA